MVDYSKKFVCGKEDYSTDSKEQMAKHLETKHKIKGAKYILEDIRENREINSLADLTTYEKNKFAESGTLAKCNCCERFTIRDMLGVINFGKDSENILIKTKQDTFIPKEEFGLIKDWEHHEGYGWLCNLCRKKHTKLAQNWELITELKDMRDTIHKEEGEFQDELIKKSSFNDARWEEYEFILDYEKKVGGKKLNFVVVITMGECIEWPEYWNDHKPGRNMTSEELKAIETEAKKISETLMKECSNLRKKHHKKHGVVVVEEDGDAGFITFRKDIIGNNAPGRILLVTIESQSDYDEGEEEIEEIVRSDFFICDKYIFESCITESGRVHEYMWEMSGKKPESSDKKLIHKSLAYIGGYAYQKIERYEGCAMKLRRLLSNEFNETSDVVFAQRSFKVMASNKDGQRVFNLQHRSTYRPESYGEPIELKDFNIKPFINLYEAMACWVQEHNKPYETKGKINRVGDNSRHIILDKSNGLPLFGFKFGDDKEVNVKYEHGKITITPVESYEQEKVKPLTM